VARFFFRRTLQRGRLPGGRSIRKKEKYRTAMRGFAVSERRGGKVFRREKRVKSLCHTKGIGGRTNPELRTVQKEDLATILHLREGTCGKGGKSPPKEICSKKKVFIDWGELDGRGNGCLNCKRKKKNGRGRKRKKGGSASKRAA